MGYFVILETVATDGTGIQAVICFLLLLFGCILNIEQFSNQRPQTTWLRIGIDPWVIWYWDAQKDRENYFIDDQSSFILNNKKKRGHVI